MKLNYLHLYHRYILNKYFVICYSSIPMNQTEIQLLCINPSNGQKNKMRRKEKWKRMDDEKRQLKEVNEEVRIVMSQAYVINIR